MAPSKQKADLQAPLSNPANQVSRQRPTLCRENQPLNDVLRILEKDNAISAWLDSGENKTPELFITLADRLADSERKALAEYADVIVRTHDDLAKRVAVLEKENEYLRSLSLTDELTNAYNYRFFVKQLDVEMARTGRTGQPCSLMMIDLDDFKVINDTLGHDEGNKFLVKVAQVVERKLRPTDILCRYGGDEFAAIMPATSLFDAMSIAQRLRKSVSEVRLRLDHPFSVSIGLAEYDPSCRQEMSLFVNLADKALYRAKKTGKNRICYEGKLPRMGKAASVTQDEKAALLEK